MKSNGIRKREDYKKLKKDENNNIILTQGQYDLITNETGQYASANAWIELKSLKTQCLIKNFAYNSGAIYYEDFVKLNGEDGIRICKYNNIIVPYIGSEIFSVDTAKYFFVKFARGKQKIPTNPKIEYLLTLDEKLNGEEVWEGYNILMYNKGEDTLMFSKRLEEIKKFAELRHIHTYKIQEILDDFIRQEIFKKTSNYVDNHNVNWALGIDGKRVRVFPAYDFDFCSGIRNKNVYETICDNKLSDLKSFIEQYKDLPWMKDYIKEVIQNFDIDNVFKFATERTEVDIPKDIKKYFKDFYEKKKEEIEHIYQEIFEQRKKGDDEICI